MNDRSSGFCKWWVKTILLGCMLASAGCQATSTTPPSIQQLHDDARTERLQRRSETYQLLLTTKVELHADEHPLETMVRQLQAKTGIDFVTKWDNSGFGDGMDPEALIIIKFTEPAPPLRVLQELQTQATTEETSWNLGPGYVRFGLKNTLVTSPEFYVVAYPIPWLLDHAPMFRDIPADQKKRLQEHFAAQEVSTDTETDTPNSEVGGRLDIADPIADEIIDIITSVIDPLQWEKNGGEGGSIRYLAGTLIINAADFLHRQIGEYGYGESLAR